MCAVVSGLRRSRGVPTTSATGRPTPSASQLPATGAAPRVVARPFGFREVGEQFDEVDGLEVVYEPDL